MKLLMMGMAFALLTGCVSIKANKDEFSYSRFGKQKIGKFEGELGADGTYKVMFEKQEADSTMLLNAIDNLAKAYLKTQVP